MMFLFQLSGIPFMTSLLNTYISLAALALFISIIVVAIVYAIGKAISNEKVVSWAKIEFFEFAYSLFLLVALPFGVVSLSSIVPGFLDQNIQQMGLCSSMYDAVPGYEVLPCHMRIAKAFLADLFGDAIEFTRDIFYDYTWKSWIHDMGFELEFATDLVGAWLYNPVRGFFALDLVVESQLFDMLLKVLMVIKFQEILLEYISTAIFPVLFVLGVVLRSFFFTRRLGGLLLGIAIALYFIFPMFLVVGAEVFYMIRGTSPSDTIVTVHLDFSNFKIGPVDFSKKNPSGLTLVDWKNRRAVGDASQLPYDDYERWLARIQDDLPSFCTALSNQPTPGAAGAASTRDSILEDVKTIMDSFTSGGTAATAKYVGMGKYFSSGGFIDSMSRILFFSVFFSFLGIMATIAGAKSLSITFGGDTEIAGLTRLI